MSIEVDLPMGIMNFIVSVWRGGEVRSEDKGDVAFDDFKLTIGKCFNGNYMYLPFYSMCYMLGDNIILKFLSIRKYCARGIFRL